MAINGRFYDEATTLLVKLGQLPANEMVTALATALSDAEFKGARDALHKQLLLTQEAAKASVSFVRRRGLEHRAHEIQDAMKDCPLQPPMVG